MRRPRAVTHHATNLTHPRGVPWGRQSLQAAIGFPATVHLSKIEQAIAAKTAARPEFSKAKHHTAQTHRVKPGTFTPPSTKPALSASLVSCVLNLTGMGRAKKNFGRGRGWGLGPGGSRKSWLGRSSKVKRQKSETLIFGCGAVDAFPRSTSSARPRHTATTITPIFWAEFFITLFVINFYDLSRQYLGRHYPNRHKPIKLCK